VAILGLLLLPAPAHAEDAPADPLADLPVAAVDVTDSDANLRSTTGEVTVLTSGADGSPTVTKLRAESPEAAAELARQLDAEPGVVAAPTRTMRAMEGAVNPEPMAAEQWNLPMVGAPDAWAVTQGAGVIVAVVDTGVDATHPDLVGRVLPELDLLPEVTPEPADNGHGTRIASLIAGNLDAAGMAGVAPQASILPVAALDPSGVGDSATVAQAIIAAADAGARVINLSLGGPDRDPVLDQACAYAFTKGALLVAAAGNSYQFGNEVQYPAASPNVLAVSSVDSTGTPSAFSNTGPHIDLAAPGQDIVAALPGATYDVESGTSFATPHVAGVLALVAAANPALSASQIESVARLTAQDDVSGNGRDDQLGHGIVRADRAVATALTLQAAPLPPDARLRLRSFNGGPEPVRRGQVGTFTVVVQARFPDGAWRPDPLPTLVRFEFRPSGARRYRTVAEVSSSPDGTAVFQTTPTRSGTWRAKVRQANGTWTASRVDRLKVRR
jgi:type VII secretion-associated serine protease mycosin